MKTAEIAPGLRRPTAAQLTRFVAGTLAVSAGCWLIGSAPKASLISPALPVSALMFLAPSAGLLTAVGPHRTWDALRALLPRQELALRRAAGWLATMPLVVLAAARPDWSATTPPLPVPSLVLLAAGFVVSSLLEQLGWTWFAVEGLAPRCGVWQASVVTGAFWAGLHIIPWLQAGHSTDWVIGQALFSVVFLCLIIQAYLPYRSLYTAIALHASYDITWVWLPSLNAPYDPLRTTLGTTALLTVICAERRTNAKGARSASDGRWHGQTTPPPSSVMGDAPARPTPSLSRLPTSRQVVPLSRDSEATSVPKEPD